MVRWEKQRSHSQIKCIQAGVFLAGLSALSWFQVLPIVVSVGLTILAWESLRRGFAIKKTFRGIFENLYSRDSANEFLGMRQLTLTEDGLADSMDNGLKLFVPWNLFKEVQNVDDTLVLVAGIITSSIPKRAFSELDWPGVVAFVNEHVPQSKQDSIRPPS